MSKTRRWRKEGTGYDISYIYEVDGEDVAAVYRGGDRYYGRRPGWAGSRAVLEATGGGPASMAYFAVASALDALTEDRTAEVWVALDPQTRRAIRSAESALRRAAFSIVVHAGEHPR